MKLNTCPGDLFELAGETGLSPELLRLWQNQAGFPATEPAHDGQPHYPAWQVRRLKLVRRLIALGEPPARLVELDEDAITALLDYRSGDTGRLAAPAATTIPEYVAMFAGNAFAEAEGAMQGHVIEHGLEDFVLTVAAPLCVAIGKAWEEGRLGLFQERVFADVLTRTLRACAGALFQPFGAAAGSRPLVLLCTPPQEAHILGLAMTEAMLHLQDCRTLHLGPAVPEAEIAHAAIEARADILALSFSVAHHPARTVDVLVTLRERLPPSVLIWAGGANCGLRHPLPPGIAVFDTLAAIPAAIAQWRAGRA